MDRGVGKDDVMLTCYTRLPRELHVGLVYNSLIYLFKGLQDYFKMVHLFWGGNYDLRLTIKTRLGIYRKETGKI